MAVQFDEVAAMVAAYGQSDLLCYRATDPAGLVRAQAEAWDPMLDWAGRTYGARLVTTRGVDPDQVIAAIRATERMLNIILRK